MKYIVGISEIVLWTADKEKALHFYHHFIQIKKEKSHLWRTHLLIHLSSNHLSGVGLSMTKRPWLHEAEQDRLIFVVCL
jgi:hypothetical protein